MTSAGSSSSGRGDLASLVGACVLAAGADRARIDAADKTSRVEKSFQAPPTAFVENRRAVLGSVERGYAARAALSA